MTAFPALWLYLSRERSLPAVFAGDLVYFIALRGHATMLSAPTFSLNLLCAYARQIEVQARRRISRQMISRPAWPACRGRELTTDAGDSRCDDGAQRRAIRLHCRVECNGDRLWLHRYADASSGGLAARRDIYYFTRALLRATARGRASASCRLRLLMSPIGRRQHRVSFSPRHN